jgi:HEAT repeat protein
MSTWILLCGLLVQDDNAAKEALERFATAMKTAATPAARASAVSELSRTPHEKTLPKIAPFVVSDAKEVRIAAAKGLGNFKDYKAKASAILQGALGGINAKEPDVQAAVFEGLAMLRDETALPLVHKNMRGDYVKASKAAATAVGKMRFKESMEPLIELLTDIDKWLAKKQGGGYKDDKGQAGDEAAQKSRLEDLRKSVIQACKDITKEKWATSEEWQIWWSRKKANFTIPE